MPTCEELENKIKKNLPNANLKIKNPRGDGAHFELEIYTPEFEGKTLLEKHRLVYSALGEKFAAGSSMHALKITIKNQKKMLKTINGRKNKRKN